MKFCYKNRTLEKKNTAALLNQSFQNTYSEDFSLIDKIDKGVIQYLEYNILKIENKNFILF